MTTGIKRKRIGFYSIHHQNRPAKPKPAAKKQERSDSLMTTDEYLRYLEREVRALEIRSQAASTPAERKQFETRKAEREDLLQTMRHWFGKDKSGAVIEARAFRSDGSLIEPEIIH